MRSCKSASTSSGVILIRSRWFTPCPMAFVMGVLSALLGRSGLGAYVARTMAGTVRLEIDGPIATITNDNPDKHNAFDDDMDVQLFAAIDELVGRPDIRAVIWRGEWQVVLVGPRRRLDRHAAGPALAPRADAPRPPRHPAHLGHRRARDRRVQGLGHGRLVPARAAVRHPHRGRGHALPPARGDVRRDPRHRRRRGAATRCAGTAS